MRRPAAFTVIEVLIAMSLLAGTVYVLSDLQIRSMFRLLRTRDAFSKIFFLKNYVMQQMPLLSPDFKPIKETLTQGVVTVNRIEFEKKSLLKDVLGEKIALVNAQCLWQRGPYQEQMLCYAFVPTLPSKKGKRDAQA